MRNEYAHSDDDYEHSKEILSNEKKQDKSATWPKIEDNGDVNISSSGSKGKNNRENSGIGIKMMKMMIMKCLAMNTQLMNKLFQT